MESNACCFNRPCAMFTAVFTCVVVFHNATKLPAYLPVFGELPATNKTWNADRCKEENPDERWCLGLEGSANLGMWFGYRGAKIHADPSRWLAPHTVMGSSILLLMALIWLQKITLAQAAPVWFPLTSIMYCHAMFMRHGLPVRVVGDLTPPSTPPWYANILNWMFVVHWCGVGVFFYSRTLESKVENHKMLIISYAMTAITPFLAAFAEINSLINAAGRGWTALEGDMPLWWSADPEYDPFSQISSPGVGQFITIVLFLAATAGTVFLCMRPMAGESRREVEMADANFMDEQQ